MTDEMRIFNDERFGQLRTLTEDGKTLFCGVDIAKPLAYKNIPDALARHCKGIVKRDTLTNGGVQELIFIPEGDVYRLIARSRLPEAQRFESWIFDEVVPSIRENGGYIAGQDALPDDELLAKALLVAQRKIEQREYRIHALESDNRALTAEIAAFEPVRGYVNQILSASGTMTTTQIAADYGLSARKLNEILHEEKIQHKVHTQWILYAEQMNKGYTQSITIPITRKDGTPDTKMHTQWTQKGRLMIHGILTRRGVFANADIADNAPDNSKQETA